MILDGSNIWVQDVECDYTGTRTELNLWVAYIGESMARNKYDYYASAAKKAGYEQMAEVFTTIAMNEREHAKLWYKELQQIASTLPENLLRSAEAEHHEWTAMYAAMAATAEDEGFPRLAEIFRGVAKIEQSHENQFRQLFSQIDNEEVFARSNIVMWQCRNCGHIELGMNAPETCPVCDHPQAFFQCIE